MTVMKECVDVLRGSLEMVVVVVEILTVTLPTVVKDLVSRHSWVFLWFEGLLEAVKARFMQKRKLPRIL